MNLTDLLSRIRILVGREGNNKANENERESLFIYNHEILSQALIVVGKILEG